MSERRWTVDARERGVRLDKFLAAADRLGSRSKATAAIDRNKVFVNDQEMASADAGRLLDGGDRIRLWLDRPGSARPARTRRRRDGELTIVYEDAALLVADKPAGLLAVPLGGAAARQSLVDLIADHLRAHGKRQPQVVHRIDRDTSGLVLFAKDPGALAGLKAQFRQHTPDRVYLAVVHGHPVPEAGTWRDHLAWDGDALVQRISSTRHPRSHEAISHYRVIERLRGAALLEVRLVTGKRNQIRVQAQRHGHPLVGERMYVDEHLAAPIPFQRQALHARHLAFDHPVTGRRLQLDSPLPPDLADLIARLR